ncbi:hypothetical protein N7533_003510 [Penicillium manginii]|uniref:uncharacterized protein n=1 Tax=Penicillium manginii TaxID=203109 RepID=UPI002547A658|nr:uncharacterized protein N7533_003510 [Penicillium manginii]KAJ5761471.1 hypothetical protein N7533_003510 [Penicillium manginii]
MDRVNKTVLDALEEHQSIRIHGDLPTKKLDSDDYLASTRKTISEFVSFWNDIANLQLLAVEIWPRRSYFALDFNNSKYDYDKAHTQVIVLPVYLLRMSRRSGSWRIFRHKPEDSHLAKRIAFLHEGNGQDPTPFLEDHIKGVVYGNPRNLLPPLEP